VCPFIAPAMFVLAAVCQPAMLFIRKFGCVALISL
jgi:hypothetical protein